MPWFLMACTLLLVSSSLAEKAPYTSFAKDATLAPPVVYCDYIIVGGGTAGCALAATLSTAATVLVLERGGLPYGTLAMNKSSSFRNLWDISPTSTSQLFVTTDGVYSHRGRVLGGSSAINGGFHSRASDLEIQENGWDPQLVNESYHWIESKLVIESQIGKWQAAIRGGLLEAGVAPDWGFTYEHKNNGVKAGGTTFDNNGHRHGAADLLEYANSMNIGVYLHATVSRVLFENERGRPKETAGRPKAYGVSFIDSKGLPHKAYLNKKPTSEIIISAGAIGSPQLLLLSGIGPSEDLKALGIDVIFNQSMVGEGMTDNAVNLIIVPSLIRDIELSIAGIVGVTNSGNYIEAISGLQDLNLTHITGIEAFSSAATETIQPLNQILPETRRGFDLNPNLNPNTNIGIIGQKIAKPYSKGSLKLETREPNDNPRVTFNYYQDRRDVLKCVKGMEIIKNVVESHSFSEFRNRQLESFENLKNFIWLSPLNLRKKHLKSINSMEQFCIDTVMTSWHYYGGCQMDRVVDRDYKVIGVDSLRVIDGSTFLSCPGTNPQATVMMLGRYMGQRILHEQATH